MPRITISLRPANQEPVVLQAVDMAAALVIADINLIDGSAELQQDGKRLALLQRHGGPTSSFWELG